MSESNEHLLDGLFQDEQASEPSSASSDDGEDAIVETAEMIIRSAKLDEKFCDKWISENGLLFYFDSKRQKLILLKNNCYFDYEGDGEFQFTGRVDSQIQSDSANDHTADQADTSDLPCVWVTSVPRSFLTIRHEGPVSDSPSSKRQRTEPNYKIKFLDEFFHKYVFDESFIRHILKLDRLLVSYIVPRFNPMKAKPKNAFSNFCDSLISKFPQPWRWKSLLAIPEEDRVDCDCKPLRSTLFFGTNSDLDFELFSDSPEEKFSAQFFFLGNDVYVMMNEEQIPVTVLVDGVRCTAGEGPVGPLKDGSVLTVSLANKPSTSELVPDHMFIVELAKTEQELVARRLVSES